MKMIRYGPSSRVKEDEIYFNVYRKAEQKLNSGCKGVKIMNRIDKREEETGGCCGGKCHIGTTRVNCQETEHRDGGTWKDKASDPTFDRKPDQ